MRAVFSLAGRAARSTASVLVQGETGTGKELVARCVHTRSSRRDSPFIGINCAAFPDALLESELFGHARGAFTGALHERRGLFEAAGGGTLLLDEVGEMSPPLQARLLRVLQEREIRPLGSCGTRPIDVRIVAATHRNLRDEVACGAFRQDLFYRLAVIEIAVPPLRERPDDIGALAAHFLRIHGEREQRAGVDLGASALALLRAHDWPGNARELENEVQRALALADPGETIEQRHLSAALRGCEATARLGAPRPGDSLRVQLARFEAQLVRAALERNGGRRSATARELGVTREGLYRKMRRLGIE